MWNHVSFFWSLSSLFNWLQYIDQNAEEESSDDDSTSEQDNEDGDDVAVKIGSLKIAEQVLIHVANIFNLYVNKLCHCQDI